MSSIQPRKPRPADVYLTRDAADLCRIRYNLPLGVVCSRAYLQERHWVCGVLVDRGWSVADVARTMGYQHTSTLYAYLDSRKE